jgi:hypothetical protein
MDRKWLYRALAASMGIAATLTLAGAASLKEKRAAAAQAELRTRARNRALAYYRGQKDVASAAAVEKLYQGQAGNRAAGITTALAVLAEPVDALVLCRALGILIHHAPQLNATDRATAMARTHPLLAHQQPVVRAYALSLSGKLADGSTLPLARRLAGQDADPRVRAQAARAVKRLKP